VSITEIGLARLYQAANFTAIDKVSGCSFALFGVLSRFHCCHFFTVFFSPEAIKSDHGDFEIFNQIISLSILFIFGLGFFGKSGLKLLTYPPSPSLITEYS